MSSEDDAQGNRIQELCESIWGDCYYELDIESDDYEAHSVVVKKDFGSEFGPPLTMTGMCYSVQGAFDELERMLTLWAAQVQSGKSMTRGQRLDIFGGPNGRNRRILEVFEREMEQHKAKKPTA